MLDNQEQMIRERAYAIWQEEGYPLDRALDHWLRAEAEIAADRPAGLFEDGKPAPKSRSRAR